MINIIFGEKEKDKESLLIFNKYSKYINGFENNARN